MDFFGAQDTILWFKYASKVALDKSAFVKFKISNNFKQNIDESDLNQPKIHRKFHTSLMYFKNLKKKRDFC